ncbi:endoribonuclease YbeY isoform X3 [Trachypithecus francoisi]|uniref:endoribonuclease YbeY isoform X3 n=1 Tax=Trachypithecus francoisi TaxID=54180 RepID=UPI00141B7862|nr:endoribonuclease YbeY isoform X3 [Trachypithecus francoisi]
MSLVIRNLQQVIPIRRAPLRSKIEIVRRILGVQKFDLGIICVDNKNIQHINRIYRGRNVPTDVLSFPFHEVTATHGLCHLLGFTHSTEAEWQQIQLLASQEESGSLTGVALNLQICWPRGGSDPRVCAALGHLQPLSMSVTHLIRSTGQSRLSQPSCALTGHLGCQSPSSP